MSRLVLQPDISINRLRVALGVSVGEAVKVAVGDSVAVGALPGGVKVEVGTNGEVGERMAGSGEGRRVPAVVWAGRLMLLQAARSMSIGTARRKCFGDVSMRVLYSIFWVRN
jgi:hypothetical protein